MTLDEAIAHCLEVAEKNEISVITYKNCKEIKTNMYEKLIAEKTENDCRECAAHYRQLAEWLKELKELRAENKVLALEIELKEAKRLLIAAAESFDKLQKTVISFHSVVCDYAMQFANPYDACYSCPLSNSRYRTCKWRFADEALKIVGE